MGEPCRSLMPFSNGVYDMETGEFTPHPPDNWLTNHNGVYYTQPVPGENIHDHAPNFHKWLSYTADRDALKMQRIAAALFMVLANRYDWQLFLEITGKGGSDKSIFTQVATLRAVVIATNNTPMIFTERAGGEARRRVIFRFNNQVREVEKDRDLPARVAAEIPVIIRRLLATFAEPEKARALLLELRDSA